MKIFAEWIEQGRYILQEDPACKHLGEALFLYPMMSALRAHRLANWFYKRGHTTFARFLSQRARHRTGIEIHPGASIGHHIFMDHAMGIVIGETAVVGDYVTIFHGVTLGGTSKDKGAKRHPSVGNHVTIGAGATLLGPIFVGNGAKIGAGAVVLQDVPEGATAVGVPARIIER